MNLESNTVKYIMVTFNSFQNIFPKTNLNNKYIKNNLYSLLLMILLNKH